MKILPKCSLGIDKSQAFPAPKDKNDRQSAGSDQETFSICSALFFGKKPLVCNQDKKGLNKITFYQSITKGEPHAPFNFFSVSIKSSDRIVCRIFKPDICFADSCRRPTGKYTLFFYVQEKTGLISPFKKAFLYKSMVPAPGDVNGDERTDLTDVILAFKIVCSADTGFEAITLGGDLNGDGKIGIEDLISLLRQLAG